MSNSDDWTYGDSYYGLWVGKSYIGVVDYQFADNPSANYTEIFMGPAGALRSPVTAPKVMGGLLLALAILVVGVFALLVRRRRAVPTRQPLPGLCREGP